MKTVTNAQEVYVTLFPGDKGGGKRFSAQLTDELHATKQYFDSLTLTKKVAQQ